MSKFPGLSDTDMASLFLIHAAHESRLTRDVAMKRMNDEIDNEEMRLQYICAKDEALMRTIVDAVNMNNEYLLAYLRKFGVDHDQ